MNHDSPEILPPSGRQQRFAELPESERRLLAEVGRRLREARKLRGQTIAQLAAEVRIDASYLGELERGRANVSVTTLATLARAVGVSTASLLANSVEGE